MRIIITLLLLITSTSLLYSQDLLSSDKLFIDSLMNSTYKADEPGAVILAARDGKVLFRKAYGMASLELQVPEKPEFVFPLGSIVKQFTAVSILQLAEKGKLFLKDDIRKYLPEFDTHGKEITIENLLTHTSGIKSLYERPDYKILNQGDCSRDEALRLIESDSLYFEPGSDWNYSNSGFTLAGLIVEKLSGTSLGDYFRKNIFMPLGMNNTSLLSNDRIIKGLPPYYKAATDTSYMQGPKFNWNLFFSAGDLISCVDDMLKWDEALYTDKLLRQDWLQKAWNSYVLPGGEKTNYGYGWAVDEYRGLKVIQHDGIMGYLSDAIRIPEKHVFVIIVSNNGSVSPNEIADQTAFRLAGKPLVTKAVNQPDTQQLKEYTGVYEISRPAGNVYRKVKQAKQYRYITLSGNKLYAQRSGMKKYELSCCGKDLFFFTGTNAFIRFDRDDNKKIIRLVFYSEPINYGPDFIEERTDMTLPVEAER